MKKRITITMIRKGLENGTIKITDEGSIMSNKKGGGTICAIGDSWFYAFGQEGEVSTPEEYKQNVSLRIIAEEIYDVLSGNRGFETEFPDEYKYYYYYLKEHGC